MSLKNRPDTNDVTTLVTPRGGNNKMEQSMDDDSVLDSSEQTNRPSNVALHQQRVPAWHPILDPVWVIIALFYIGVIMVPVGLRMNALQKGAVEETLAYDGYDIPNPVCGINETYNANRSCLVTLTASSYMEAPVLLYYELDNFHQNHRKYYTSFDPYQLAGQARSGKKTGNKDCGPLNKMVDKMGNNITLNPCGMVANTFFNDYFTLVSGNDATGKPLVLREDGIAWTSDVDYMFGQPQGFRSQECAVCNDSCCEGDKWSCTHPYIDKNGNCYSYFYPNDNTTQYLYETYPDIISPIEGVMNEHFIVWMRVAPQPRFRKLYGWFDQPIAQNTTLVFQINANYVVTRFRGTKTLILTTTNIFGGRNPFAARSMIICGILFLLSGLFFTIKHVVRPRRLADKKHLELKLD